MLRGVALSVAALASLLIVAIICRMDGVLGVTVGVGRRGKLGPTALSRNGGGRRAVGLAVSSVEGGLTGIKPLGLIRRLPVWDGLAICASTDWRTSNNRTEAMMIIRCDG